MRYKKYLIFSILSPSDFSGPGYRMSVAALYQGKDPKLSYIYHLTKALSIYIPRYPAFLMERKVKIEFTRAGQAYIIETGQKISIFIYKRRKNNA